MNKKITIFTVEIINNGYLNHPVCQLCLNSWYRLKERLEKFGYEAEIKIYRYDDPEVIEFHKMYPHLDKFVDGRLNILSDIFRIWILSKHENYLWLDSDIYFYKDIDDKLDKFNDVAYFKEPYFIMYNSNNLNFFKDVLNFYLSFKPEDLGPDKAMYKLMNTREHVYIMAQLFYMQIKEPLAGFDHCYRHLTKLMRTEDQKYYLVQTEDDIKYLIDNFNTLTEGHLNSNRLENTFLFMIGAGLKKPFLKSLSKTDYAKYIYPDNLMNTHNDETFINFLKENYVTLPKLN